MRAFECVANKGSFPCDPLVFLGGKRMRDGDFVKERREKFCKRLPPFCRALGDPYKKSWDSLFQGNTRLDPLAFSTMADDRSFFCERVYFLVPRRIDCILEGNLIKYHW